MTGRMMQTKEKRITITVAILTSALFLFLVFVSHRQDLTSDNTIREYNTGWECSYEEIRNNLTLPASLNVPKDTVITLRNVLPEDTDDGSGIVFRSRMQRVSVYIDGRMTYEYPSVKMIGNALPSIWNFVRLTEEDAGKTVEIRIESPYRSFSGALPEVLFGNYNQLISEISREQMPVFLLSMFVGVTGAAVLLIAMLFRKYRLYAYQGSLGILLIFLALWLTGEARMPFRVIGMEAQHYITLFSLFLCPFFLIAYLRARWNEICGRITGILFYVNGGCALLALLLQVTGICDFAELIPAFHVLAAVSLYCTVYIYIQAARREKTGFIRSELVCMVLIFFAGAAEFLQFYLTGGVVGLYIRTAILIYALNLFRICAGMLFWKLKENRELERQLKYSRAELMSSQIKPHFIIIH